MSLQGCVGSVIDESTVVAVSLWQAIKAIWAIVIQTNEIKWPYKDPRVQDEHKGPV